MSDEITSKYTVLSRGDSGAHDITGMGTTIIHSGEHQVTHSAEGRPVAVIVDGGTVTSLAVNAPQSILSVDDAFVKDAIIRGETTITVDDGRIANVTAESGRVTGILENAFATSITTGKADDSFAIIGNGGNYIESGAGDDQFHLAPWDFYERGLGDVFSELGRELIEGPTAYNPEGSFGGVEPGKASEHPNEMNGGEGHDTVFIKDAARYRFQLDADSPDMRIEVINGRGHTVAMLSGVESVRDEVTGEEILSTLTSPDTPQPKNVDIIRRRK